MKMQVESIFSTWALGLRQLPPRSDDDDGSLLDVSLDSAAIRIPPQLVKHLERYKLLTTPSEKDFFRSQNVSHHNLFGPKSTYQGLEASIDDTNLTRD